MADTRVTIDVDLNTSPAAQGLRDLQRQYNAFTSSLNRNNAAQATAARQYSDQLLRLVNSSEMFTAETVRMQTAAGRLDKTLAKGQVTMGQFFSARFIRDSTAAAQVLSLANARAAALQTQFFATSAAANGMRDAIAVRPYEAFNSALAVSAQKLAIHRAMLMQATTHMINFGKNTQWAGRQLMVGFTVPLTIFGGVAGKVFRELEEEVINFKKVYGDIFTTEEETGKALAAVQELSKEFTKYGIAVKDTMALANVAAQSGLRNAELMAATTQATRLATLGQMEQAEAMKTIISLQTAFKSSNEELAESVDFLNIIENQTVLALQDVASAIPRVAPVIQGLGGDVKDLAVLLVAMKEGGVTAGEGANALKSSLGRLIVPTKAAKEMAAEFGISLEQIVENNRGQLLPMIMELGQALEGVDSLGRQQLLSTIFGKFQYARIGALFDNITRDSSQAARAMELMNLSAAELGQIAEKELKTVEESVGARFTAAMEKAKLAIAPLGEAFLNLSIPLINMFTKIIEKFNELPDFAKKFAVFGSVIVGVVIPVGTMFLGLLMNLIGTLIKFGGVIGIAFKGFTSGGIKGAIQAVSQALNYMSLEEIDAANAAQQLGQSTQVVNEALRQQVPRTAEAALGINQLGAAYASLILRMREAAALSATQGGAFVVPGAAADLARKGPRPRGYNKGGKVLKFNDGNTVPGVGNTDTVPAMLTPGEFVVNKQATKDNLETLQAINNGDVQYRNKGGGIVTPGRMFYGPKLGRPPAPPKPSPSAEDYVDAARKGNNPLEEKAAAQAKEAGMGATNVSDDMARARAASSQAEIQAIKNKLKEYVDNYPTDPNKKKSSNQIEQDLEKLLGEKIVTNQQLSKWMKETKGVDPEPGPKGYRWDKNDLDEFVKGLQIGRSTQGSHFGTATLTAPQARRLAEISNDQKDLLAKELVDAGVPVTGLTDDFAELSTILNQAANRGTSVRRTIFESIDEIDNYADLIKVGPAMRRAGVKEKDLIDGMKKYLSDYAKTVDENGNILGNTLITDKILTDARNAAINGITVRPRITGSRIPTLPDLRNWVASKRKIDVADVTENDIKDELALLGFDLVPIADKNKKIKKHIRSRKTGITQKIGSSSDYRRSWDNEDILQLAKGGLIPGIPGFMSGSRVSPIMAGIQRRRAQVAVASGKSLDDIIFARGADGKLALNSFDLLTLLKHNPNLTKKQLAAIQKYHGSRIRSGMFGKMDKEFGVRFKDTDWGTWKDAAKIMEERGYPVIQRRNEGGEIFESGSRTIVPGVGNTDTVPAMLTPGEFVINKQATRENKPLLQAINNGNLLNKGGKVQFLNAGNPVSDWGDFADPNEEKKLSKKERFERSFVGRYAERRLAAGDRAGRLLALSATMQMEAERSGIFVKELADFEKLPQKQQYKERNLRKAEVAARRYEKAVGIWNANGRPAPPPVIKDSAQKAASGQRSAAGSPILANVVGGAPTTDYVYGYDPNKKPITNWNTAANMAFNGQLFDADGKRVPASQVRMMHKGVPAAPERETPAKKIGMTRAQKIWAVISALTMAGTATGITLYERHENKKEQEGLRFNNGGKVPAMLTPGEFIVDKDKASENLGLLYAINSGGKVPGYAIGGLVAGAAQLALPLGLSLAAAPIGAKAGEAVGGETGAMVGGMAASFLPFMLPWGRILGRGKSAPAGSETTMLANAMPGTKAANEGIKTTTKSMLASSAQFLKLSRIIPLLFNPYTALAAAVVAATYTLLKMNQSNNREFEAGRKFADALTTSSDEISALGKSAKDRAQDISSYLNQSEESFVEREFNKKIAKAKTEREKLALKKEKREAMQRAGGEQTRRSTVRDFYNARITELASQGASDAERQNIYAQRNAALAAQRLSGINLDPKFGRQFIEGQGKEVFEEFKAVRRLGMQGGTNFKYAQQLAEASYGATTSVTEAAARDLGAKLSQYIMSGVMTEDEASSVAAAISQELKDARIGKTIRQEVLSTVGADGLRAQYDPASVAMKLIEKDEKRLESTRESLFTLMNRFGGAGTTTGQGVLANMAGGLFVGQAIKDVVSANRKNNQKQAIPLAQQKQLLLPSFFMGDADEMRRQMGSMIEMQTTQMEMLEENIAAVGLAYNNLIEKADTLQKKKDLEMEKSLAIARLQEKQDAAREQQFAMFGGSEAWAEQAREQIDAAAFSFSNKFDAYTNSQIQDLGEAMALPVNWSDISALGSNIVNAGKQVWEGFDAVTTQAQNWFNGLLGDARSALKGTIFDFTGGDTFGAMYGEQSLEAVRKKYEGTAAGAALETFLQLDVIEDIAKDTPDALLALTQNMLVMGEEYANAIMGSTMSILGALDYATRNVDVEGNEILDAKKITGIQQRITTLTSGLTLAGGQQLSAEGIREISVLMGSMATDLKNGGDDLLKTFDLLEEHPMFTGEQAEIATERWANFVNQTRELTEIALEDGRTLYDELIEDEQFIELVLTDDKFFEDYLDFVEWLNKQGEDTKIAIRTEIENADDVTDLIQGLVNDLADFDAKAAGAKFTNFINRFSNLEMGSEFTDEIERITRGLNELNEIEDPEIKAKLLAEIDPNVDLLIRLMNQLAASPGNVEIQNQILDVAQDLNVSGRAATTKEEPDKKKSGSGGATEDPLNALMRELRDTTDLLAKIGMDMLSVGREAKSVFDKLRDQGVNEVVIDYLRSMGPEEAIKVGQDILKNEKKLNTIMQLAGENARARLQDARRSAEERAKFARELVAAKPLSGAPLLDLEAALEDPEFMEAMMAARGEAKPNKAMRDAQQNYFARLQAERQAMSAMAPAIVQSQEQQNISRTYAANQLRAKGLSEEEVQVALESEVIMNRVRQRLSQSKSIGPVVVEMTKDLYASTRTAMDILDDGISKVGSVFDFLAESLSNASQQIDKFTIRPLQEELEEIQDESSSYAESQRRLSRSLSLLQKTESDTRERQKEDEDKINESYDLRIEALEKVDKINKDIEERQKGQISVADALSRGDIGAAARTAQEMQAKAAQARREEAIQAMRDQKEEDMDNLKKAHEEELKNLTISVNGELLNREQIQERIDDLETKIYDNSLKEYDMQQKINKALDDRRKIEEQIEKNTLASQALNKLQEINQETDIPTRQRIIDQAKQTVSLIGGTESERLISAINQNMQGLLSSTGSTAFSESMINLTESFGSTMGTIATDIQGLNINIPGIQTALNTAVNTATTALPNIFNGVRDQITKLNDEIAIDPESDKNPFAKVYKAIKKLAAKIEEEFVNIKLPPGPGGPKDEPKPGDDLPVEGDREIPAAVLLDKPGRKALRSRIDTINLADGRKARVTKYYGDDGKVIDNFTKYEITEPTYQTGAGVQQSFTGKEFKSRQDFFTAGGSQLGQGIEMNLPYRINNLIPSGGMPLHGPVSTLDQDPQSSPEWWQSLLGTLSGAARGAVTPGVGPLLGGFLGYKQVQDNFKASGQYGAEGYKLGWEEYYKDKTVQNEMGEAPKESVDKGQGAKSPATKLEPSGKFGAQGYVKGFKEYFEDSTDTILGAKIIGWFRRSMGSEGGESPAVSGIGRNISGSIAIQISKAFTELTTASLPINVAAWLKRSLGIEGVNISSQIRLVGENIATGIKKGMEEWFGKLNVDIREPLKTWLNNAFGIVGGQPSTQSKPIGMLVASGIKEGMKNWFDTGKSSGNDLWNNSFDPWIKESFGISGKQGQEASTKTKEIGEKLTAGIAKGMETVPDLGEVASNVYLATGTALGLSVNSKTGSVSPGAQGSKFYELGVSVLDTIIKGINDQNVNSRLDAAINSRMPKETPIDQRYFGGIIRRAFGGMISYKGSREPAPGMMMGGKVKKYAIGGFVPGRGMTDKVPALLTPGEFVVRKSVAQQMMPALKDMNSQVFPGMGMPQSRSMSVSSPQFDTMKKMSVDQVRFGIPQSINSFTYPTTNMNVTQSNTETNPTNYNVGPSNVQYNYNLNVTARTNASADEIANTVMYKIKRFDDRRIKGTEIG